MWMINLKTIFLFLSDQFNEQLISPKEFVCFAGKSTLKDWKRAIRLNGTMLRSERIKFYRGLNAKSLHVNC